MQKLQSKPDSIDLGLALFRVDSQLLYFVHRLQYLLRKLRLHICELLGWIFLSLPELFVNFGMLLLQCLYKPVEFFLEMCDLCFKMIILFLKPLDLSLVIFIAVMEIGVILRFILEVVLNCFLFHELFYLILFLI